MAFKGVSMIIVYFSVIFLTQITDAKNEINWEVKFGFTKAIMKIGEQTDFDLTINTVNKLDLIASNATIRLISSDANIVKVSKIIQLREFKNDTWSGKFVVTPVGLGETNIYAETDRGNKPEISFNRMDITVLRNRIVFNIDEWILPRFSFYASHILIVMFNILFGAVFDLKKLKALIQMPLQVSVAFMFNLLTVALVGNLCIACYSCRDGSIVLR